MHSISAEFFSTCHIQPPPFLTSGRLCRIDADTTLGSPVAGLCPMTRICLRKGGGSGCVETSDSAPTTWRLASLDPRLIHSPKCSTSMASIILLGCPSKPAQLVSVLAHIFVDALFLELLPGPIATPIFVERFLFLSQLILAVPQIALCTRVGLTGLCDVWSVRLFDYRFGEDAVVGEGV